MIPLDQLKESSFYQFIVEEGLEEGRKKGLEEGRQEGLQEGVADTLSKLIAKRFPDLNVTSEIDRIHDVNTLQELCLEVADLSNADALRARLAEAMKSTS